MHLFISFCTNITYLALFPATPLGGVWIWQAMFHRLSLTCALSMIAHDVWIRKTSPTMMLFRVQFPYSKIKIHASDTLSNNQLTFAFFAVSSINQLHAAALTTLHFYRKTAKLCTHDVSRRQKCRCRSFATCVPSQLSCCFDDVPLAFLTAVKILI